MRTSDFDILIIPGLGGSGPGHWQTRWASKLSTARRIELDDWSKPNFKDWIEKIRSAILDAKRPVLLVAHSLGAIAVVHAALSLPQDAVRGALLVAPPSEAALKRLEAVDPAFTPIPRDPLPFPSLVVASRNDFYAPFDESEELAYAWGGRLLDAGEAGHINDESGHGPWPEGLMSLAGFLKHL